VQDFHRLLSDVEFFYQRVVVRAWSVRVLLNRDGGILKIGGKGLVGKISSEKRCLLER
jgi:hypothetical protein